VITSGGDRVYPKGFPVGFVMQVSPGSDLFLNIRLKPAADLNRLEEVLVVTEPPPAQTDTEAPVRAADILAQRLPGVTSRQENGSGGEAAGQTNSTGGAPSGKTPGSTKITRPSQSATTPPAIPATTAPAALPRGKRPTGAQGTGATSGGAATTARPQAASPAVGETPTPINLTPTPTPTPAPASTPPTEAPKPQ
jgi:rod shape-determining protein MreC